MSFIRMPDGTIQAIPVDGYTIDKKLAPGIYNVHLSESGWNLSQVPYPMFLPEKIYGEHYDRTKLILDRYVQRIDKHTGVLIAGNSMQFYASITKAHKKNLF